MIRLTEDSYKPEIKDLLERVIGEGCVTETTTTSGKIDLYAKVGEHSIIIEV